MVSTEFEFPQLIKDILKGLDSEERLSILELLINNENMSYTQLLDNLDVKYKGSLNYHLNMLSKSAIIERRENLAHTSGNKSFYEISPIGKEVINGLLSSLAPISSTPMPFLDDKMVRRASATMMMEENEIPYLIFEGASSFFYPMHVSSKEKPNVDVNRSSTKRQQMPVAAVTAFAT
jgi:DNA-binding transcriptional ArsR family regulator